MPSGWAEEPICRILKEMRVHGAGWIALALLLVAGATLSAQDPDAEPVRVYTNADLEGLEPLPTQPAEPPSDEEIARRWEFVQSTIDQHYARLDAQRRHELERRMTEAEAGAIERANTESRTTLPYSYYGGYGYGYYGGYSDGPRADRGHPALSRLWERPNAEQFRPITPIHARPYQSNLFRLPPSSTRTPAPCRRASSSR